MQTYPHEKMPLKVCALFVSFQQLETLLDVFFVQYKKMIICLSMILLPPNIFTWRLTRSVWERSFDQESLHYQKLTVRIIFFAVCLMPIPSILHNKTKLKFSPFHAGF